MSRKARLAACVGKKRYYDLRQARRSKRALKEHGENGLHVYHCPFCKTWHIGHSLTYMTDYPAYGKR